LSKSEEYPSMRHKTNVPWYPFVIKYKNANANEEVEEG